MAAETSVEIVISARDRFSPAFQQLDRAFAEAERSGGGVRSALGGLEGAMSSVAEGAQAAGRATEGFAERAGESLTAFAGLRQELEEQSASLQEELGLAHGERVVAIEEETQQRLTAAAEHGLAQRSQAWTAFFDGVTARLQGFFQDLLGSDRATFQARLAMYRDFVERWIALTEHQGGAIVRLNRSFAIAGALIDAYRAANAALAQVPFPLNFAAAALVLAEGLANVQQMRQVNVAHGGIEEVPEEGTFLLRRGERVLAPRQNEALLEFMRDPGPRGGTVVERLEIHVLENATAGGALLSLESADWRRIVAEKVIPALDELAGQGIRPRGAGNV